MTVTRGAGLLLVCLLVSALSARTAAPALAAPPTTIAGEGSAGGQVEHPRSVAVDQSTGAVYVADEENRRIDEFNAAGHFIRAFGRNIVQSGADALPPLDELSELTVAATGGLFTLAYQGQLGMGGNATGKLTDGSPIVSSLLSASGRGDLEAGSIYVSSPTTTAGSFRQGQTISGPGIAPGTRITRLSATLIGLSKPATASGTGVALTSLDPIAPGQEIVGAGIPAATKVVSIGEGTLTLSASATASGSAVALSAGLPPTASAATLQSALNATPAFTEVGGSVTVSGGPGNATGSSPYSISFDGGVFAGIEVIFRGEDERSLAAEPIEAASNPGDQLTGGSPSSGATATLRARGGPRLEVCDANPPSNDVCQAGEAFSSRAYDAGELVSPVDVAVDNSAGPSAGDVYVTEKTGYDVQKFSPTGQFLASFGRGVNRTKVREGKPEAEQNRCTRANVEVEHDVCQVGSEGAGPGQFELQEFPLAIDDLGDVWTGGDNRLQQFSPEGEYLSQVSLPGGGEISGLTIDTDASSPSFEDRYTLTAPSAEIDESQEITPNYGGTYTLTLGGYTTAPITAGAEGAGQDPAEEEAIQKALEALPSVGKGNVEVFFHTVTFIRELSATDVEQMTASAGASVRTRTQSVPGTPGVLTKRKPSGEAIETLDSSGHPAALGLDPATGDLFVSDQRGIYEAQAGNATLLAYGPSGAQLEAFGFGQVTGIPRDDALAFGDAAQDLYVAVAGEVNDVQLFPLPAAGPLLREGSLAATPRSTTATVKAVLNPEGSETHYRFQYLTQRRFEEDGDRFGAGTQETALATLPADFAEHQLAVPITGLSSETAYRVRLLAHNSNGEGNTAEAEASFTTLPPALVDSESASAVTASSATLEAQVNTLGVASEYRFEYLTQAAYQENVANGLEPFAGAIRVPSPDAPIAAAEDDQGVATNVEGLQQRTVYSYRVSVHNAGGEAHGAVQAFTTQSTGGFALPDQREWEMVSPPDKHNASLEPISEDGVIQAAASGDAITYLANAPTEAETAGYANGVQVLSVRGSGGWSSSDLATPNETATGAPIGNGQEYRYFSEDISLGIVQPFGTFVPLSSEASESTPYLRSDFPQAEPTATCTSNCYEPLVTAANVPAGSEFGEAGECPENAVICGPEFVGASPDASHIILRSNAPLIEGAPAGSLYEWAGGQLSLVSLRPQAEGGQPLPFPHLGSLAGVTHSEPLARDAVSDDGSRVVFSESGGHLYLRDTVTAETVRLDAVQGGSGAGDVDPVYQAASSAGDRVFFTDTQKLTSGAGAVDGEPDLYECNVVESEGGRLTCELTDLTPERSGEPADVQGAIAGVSTTGEYAYFVADGVLAGNPGASGAHAVPGDCGTGAKAATCNLYLAHAGAVTFIATLSQEDSPDWGTGDEQLVDLTARVSPNGRWLAFMSERSLTGYDNRDAASGLLDEEVFLYDAEAGNGEGRLVCASCNPTGARPHGVVYGAKGGGFNLPLVGGGGVWPGSQWLAANVPGWTPYRTGSALYQSRYLSNSGRLFFNSSDDLVAQDTNGAEDVYEYEPPGVGSCSVSSASFGEASDGCVDLISSGTSKGESAFLDASESGNDVFFLTYAKLSPQDVDSALDIYDAHVCSAESPCLPSPPPSPPVCEGDACQPPALAPEDPTPGSLTYSGPGNLVQPLASTSVAVKPKPLTRAQKLARALKACRTKYKRSKSRRAGCERSARRRYGPAHKVKRGK